MKNVTEIQQFVAAAGFDPGPIDGVLGQRTIDAISAYLVKNNRPTFNHLPPYTLVEVNNVLWPAPIVNSPSIFDNLGTLLALFNLLKGNAVTGDQLTGILRAILAAVGGWLVSKGLIDSATATALAGAAVTILTAIWSIWSNRPKTIVPIASK